MKKLLLVFLACVCTASLVWALPDQTRPIEFNGSNIVKTTGGTVYMILVNYKGVTTGDLVQIIDGANATNGVGGTVRLTCVASGTNGTCEVPLTVGAVFDNNIYYKETKSGGNFFSDIQYF